MGSGASSTAAASAETGLSKKEIEKLYTHLSQEYSKKIDELIEERSKSGDGKVQFVDDPEMTEDEMEFDGRVDEREDEDQDADDGNDDEDDNATRANSFNVDSENEAKFSEPTTEQGPRDDRVPALDIAQAEHAKSSATASSSSSPVGVASSAQSSKSSRSPRQFQACKTLTSGTRSARQKFERLYKGGDVERKLVEMVINKQPQLLDVQVRINTKALMLLGDEALNEKSRNHVGSDTKITPKVLARLGEAFIMPEKAQKRLGMDDMSTEQRKAMFRAEAEEQRKIMAQQKEDLQKVLSMKPGSQQALVGGQRVNDKAIERLGGATDESLMSNVRTQVTEDMRITKKTIALLGDDKLLPKKAMDRRGSDMKTHQLQAMRKAETQEEQMKRAKAEQELEEVLESAPTEDQLCVPDKAKGKAKVVQLAGNVEVLPDKAQRFLGDEMTPQQRKKMLNAERKASRSSRGSSSVVN